MDYYKSDQARIGIGAWHIPPFFNVSNSFSLFVFMVGLDFKLIREEKHWLLLCFPLLEHLLFSLCQVLVISAKDHPVSFSSVLNLFLQISGQYQELSCSISRICSVALAPGLLVIFSPLLSSSASCTLHSSMLVSFCFNSKVYYCWSNYSFEKDHRLQVKGKTGSCNGKVGKQKGGEREKKTKLSIKNNRQVSKGREKEEFEADRKW